MTQRRGWGFASAVRGGADPSVQPRDRRNAPEGEWHAAASRGNGRVSPPASLGVSCFQCLVPLARTATANRPWTRPTPEVSGRVALPPFCCPAGTQPPLSHTSWKLLVFLSAVKWLDSFGALLEGPVCNFLARFRIFRWGKSLIYCP